MGSGSSKDKERKNSKNGQNRNVRFNDKVHYNDGRRGSNSPYDDGRRGSNPQRGRGGSRGAWGNKGGQKQQPNDRRNSMPAQGNRKPQQNGWTQNDRGPSKGQQMRDQQNQNFHPATEPKQRDQPQRQNRNPPRSAHYRSNSESKNMDYLHPNYVPPNERDEYDDYGYEEEEEKPTTITIQVPPRPQSSEDIKRRYDYGPPEPYYAPPEPYYEEYQPEPYYEQPQRVSPVYGGYQNQRRGNPHTVGGGRPRARGNQNQQRPRSRTEPRMAYSRNRGVMKDKPERPQTSAPRPMTTQSRPRTTQGRYAAPPTQYYDDDYDYYEGPQRPMTSHGGYGYEQDDYDQEDWRPTRRVAMGREPKEPPPPRWRSFPDPTKTGHKWKQEYVNDDYYD